MKNSTIEKILFCIPAAQLIFFVVGYYPGEIREFTLLIFLGIAGFPGSFAGIPLSESIAERFGWSLGSEPQAWLAILLSIMTNFLLIFGLIKSARGKKISGTFK